MRYKGRFGIIELSDDMKCKDFDCEICDLTFCKLNKNKVFDDVPNLFSDGDEDKKYYGDKELDDILFHRFTDENGGDSA
jgi:hypothetical protein